MCTYMSPNKQTLFAVYPFSNQAIIDMESPSTVMATMSQRLKSGKAMAVYVAK